MESYSDYDPFADVYNRHWGGFATRVLPILDRLILDGLPAGSRLLDLCCGTGQLAASLTERGYRVVGVDGSEAMVQIAKDNAPKARFEVADARSFHLDEQVDAVISTYDSLNHLMTLPDLEQAFQRVAVALTETGVFVFDLNMEEGFQTRWRGSFGIVADDEVIVARSRFDPNAAMGRMDFTLMTLNRDRWQRTDVSLTQRCYAESDVHAALTAAGFRQVNVLDARDLEADEVGRSFFVCRKDTD